MSCPYDFLTCTETYIMVEIEVPNEDLGNCTPRDGETPMHSPFFLSSEQGHQKKQVFQNRRRSGLRFQKNINLLHLYYPTEEVLQNFYDQLHILINKIYIRFSKFVLFYFIGPGLV